MPNWHFKGVVATTANSEVDVLIFDVPYDSWVIVTGHHAKQMSIYDIQKRMHGDEWKPIYSMPDNIGGYVLKHSLFLGKGEYRYGIPGGPVQGAFTGQVFGYREKTSPVRSVHIEPLPEPRLWPTATVSNTTDAAAGDITVPTTPLTRLHLRGLEAYNQSRATTITAHFYSGLDTGTVQFAYSGTTPLQHEARGEMVLGSGDKITVTFGSHTAADTILRRVLVGRMVALS